MSFQGDSIFWVEVDKVVPNPFQPRREFDEEKLKELADSIRMYGVLQPLTVTRKEIVKDHGAFSTEYELIAGERRLRASKLAGLEQVPVIIRSGEDTEQEKLELAIIENLQREDLNAVDRALAFKQLAETFRLSHSEVAKKVGRSREYISNTIRLLGLPDHMLDALRRNDMAEGHARALLMLKDRPEEQDVVFREVLLKKLSVREVERIIRKIATDKVRKQSWKNTDPGLIEIEKQFTDTLGTRVQISKTDFGGKLTIDYFSDEDLQKLLSIIKSQGKLTEVHLDESDDDNEGKPDDSVKIQSLVEATPLELAEPEDVSLEPGLEQKLEQAKARQEAEKAAKNTQPAVKTTGADIARDIARAAALAGLENRPDSNQSTLSQIPKESPEITAREQDENKPSQTPPDTTKIINEEKATPIHTAPEPIPNTTETPATQSEPLDWEESAGTTRDKDQKKEETDSDLYSLKNFSL